MLFRSARYFELKNKQQNNETKVDLSEVEDAMHDLYDYFSLGQDHMEYIDSVNLLNDPDKFGNYLVNMQNARIGAIARSLHSDMLQLAGLSEMAKKHVEDNSDLMDELLVFATSPLATIDNYMKLQEINNKITDLRFKANLERVETNVEQRKQETAKAEEGKTPEEIQALNILPIWYLELILGQSINLIFRKFEEDNNIQNKKFAIPLNYNNRDIYWDKKDSIIKDLGKKIKYYFVKRENMDHVQFLMEIGRAHV